MKRNKNIYQPSALQKMVDTLHQNKGVRIGEAGVASLCVHGNDARHPEIIQIHTDLDAGQVYLQEAEKGRYLHLDIFYQPRPFELGFAALRIWEYLRDYLIERYGGENPSFTMQDWKNLAGRIARDIYVVTAEGEGTLYRLASYKADPAPEGVPGHFHYLIKLPPEGLSEDFCRMVLAIAYGTEKALARQGLEVRWVEKIVNVGRRTEVITPAEEEKPGEGVAFGLPVPAFLAHMLSTQEKYRQVWALYSRLGSLQEVKELLERMTPVKSLFMGKLGKKHSDLEVTLHYLVNAGLAEKGLFSYRLTEEGEELKRFVLEKDKEVEAYLRRIIRQRPAYQKTTRRRATFKAQKETTINKRKVVIPPHESWLKHTALPETVVNAVVRRFLRGGKIEIRPEDIRVFGRKNNIPVDICLVIDLSGSMAGEKLRAVRYLAENLFLSTRDRVAVVTFQNMGAKVAVPFTRRYDLLKKGLYQMVPGDMTPMAHGIMESLELIRRSRAKNPLLVLITDGMPNFPLWGYDGAEDALRAAEEVARRRINFLLVGVAAYAEFMEKMAQRGKARLTFIEEWSGQQLANIVHQERNAFRFAAR